MSGAWQLKVDKSISSTVRKSAMRGLAISGEHVLGEALKTVPIEEHILEESGTVSTDPSNLRVGVSFDTPYAVYQHETFGLKHDEGRGPKYLEAAFNSERETVKEIIAKTIKGEF